MDKHTGSIREAHRLPNDNPEDQAAAFVARAYSGQATHADVQALEQWLAEDESHPRCYQAALDTWDELRVLEPYADKIEQEVLPVKPKRHAWLSVAAVLLLSIAGGWQYYVTQCCEQQAPLLSSYVTQTGEQKIVSLDDGSVITLNTNSRLLIDFSEEHRRVIMERGEAFFDVAHDNSRPFIVDTGVRSVTVLGTQFDLKKFGFDLEVAVVKGQVAVHASQEQVTPDLDAASLPVLDPQVDSRSAKRYKLTAGVSARFSGDPSDIMKVVGSHRIENVNRYPSWRYGTIRFKNQPLYEVVRELNRYTKTKVLIEDVNIMRKRVNGVFNLATVDKEVQNLDKSLPFLKVSRFPDRIALSGH
jgi:transmembrane sensor